MSDDRRPAPDPAPPCDPALRQLLEALRRAKSAEVRAIEEYLGIPPARQQRERGDEKIRAWHNTGEGQRTA